MILEDDDHRPFFWPSYDREQEAGSRLSTDVGDTRRNIPWDTEDSELGGV